MEIPFKRKPTERKEEALKAMKLISSTDSKDILGAKLGINKNGRNYEKIKFELSRNKLNLKRLGIDSSALKEFGLE